MLSVSNIDTLGLIQQNNVISGSRCVQKRDRSGKDTAIGQHYISRIGSEMSTWMSAPNLLFLSSFATFQHRHG